MKLIRNLLLYGMAAVFVLVACTTAVVEPVGPVDEPLSTTVEEGTTPAKPAIGDGEAPESPAATPTQRDFQIITLLPQDAIPAIDDPQYYTVQEANEEYDDEEQVLGVVFDGEARAYSVAKLSRHEIVNDTVGGQPISVTW